MAHETHAANHANQLPADLSAPAFVDGWKMRALLVGAVFSVLLRCWPSRTDLSTTCCVHGYWG